MLQMLQDLAWHFKMSQKLTAKCLFLVATNALAYLSKGGGIVKDFLCKKESYKMRQ
jgi:hypothetical protein